MGINRIVRCGLLCSLMLGLTTLSVAGQEARSLLPETVKNKGYVTIGSQQTVPPIEFRDTKTLEVIGASVDLLHEVGKRLQIDIRFQQAEYSALISGIEANRFDIASGAISDTAEREEKLDFINYMMAGAAILVRLGEETSLKTINDFCGHKMATLLGSRVIMDAVDKASAQCIAQGRQPIEVDQLPSAPDARQQLDLKRVDGYLGDYPALVYMLQQMPARYAIASGNYILVPYTTSWGFAKNNPSLRDSFKAAMDEIYADGTYLAILKKWQLDGVALDRITVNMPANRR
ncbi:ABC transporter substrate-binding protein [Bartonella sp. LJL80]